MKVCRGRFSINGICIRDLFSSSCSPLDDAEDTPVPLSSSQSMIIGTPTGCTLVNWYTILPLYSLVSPRKISCSSFDLTKPAPLNQSFCTNSCLKNLLRFLLFGFCPNTSLNSFLMVVALLEVQPLRNYLDLVGWISSRSAFSFSIYSSDEMPP